MITTPEGTGAFYSERMNIYVQGTSLDELTYRVQVGGVALAIAAAFIGVGLYFATKRSLDWRIRAGVGAGAVVVGVSILASFSWAISALIGSVIVVYGLVVLSRE